MESTNPSFQNKRYIPPWREPYIIGIAGCSGSGKTSIASSIIKKLNVPWTILMSMDNFYNPLTPEQKKLAFESKWDFDSPESFDLDLLVKTLKDLKQGKKVQIPTYSFKEHDRTDKYVTIYGANVIILEGIYALYDPRVLELMDLKVFVDTDFDICLARRLNRDILHRGRELVLSVQQWERFVKPNFMRHIQYTMNHADILVPRGLENVVAINMIANHIQRQLAGKSSQHVSDLLRLGKDGDSPDISKVVSVLNQTPQVKGIHTILMDQQSSRDDFIFYFDRIASLLVSRALDELDTYTPKKITTPTLHEHVGVSLPYDDLCAVSVIRGGECFTRALRATVPTIRLGKLLIQSDSLTGEPKLHTLTLPPCLDPKPNPATGLVDETAQALLTKTNVLLVDSQISSGAAATMATAVLMDHGVKEESITVIAYMATQVGLRRLKTAYPNIKVVVGRVDMAYSPRFVDTLYYGT
ncbi:uridine kinase [Trichomonascus vanleenenianus]|uniref:uridine kinase URK1 n=1 Tax=Trichomonascus vanleenenianus TaxID=2268995 RepID=UPI003ECAFFF3